MTTSTLARPLAEPGSTGVAANPSVACIFCREPIEISTFRAGERQSRSASCPNCGLQVSVGDTQWGRWRRTNAVSETDRGLAERLRARRVAEATRRILERVGGGVVDDARHPIGADPRPRVRNRG